jgi:hypothetical protein
MSAELQISVVFTDCARRCTAVWISSYVDAWHNHQEASHRVELANGVIRDLVDQHSWLIRHFKRNRNPQDKHVASPPASGGGPSSQSDERVHVLPPKANLGPKSYSCRPPGASDRVGTASARTFARRAFSSAYPVIRGSTHADN